MTIVKVQRPITTNDPLRHWIIYDKFDARHERVPEKDMDPRIVQIMNNRPRRPQQFKSFFMHAEWDRPNQHWDMSKAELTEDKRW